MNTATIHLDRPPYALVENTIRHALRELYGFVPLNLGAELADHIHTAVTEYQNYLVEDLKSSGVAV